MTIDTGHGFLDLLIYVLIVGLILGVLHFLIGKAPFLTPTFKAVLQWIIWLVGGAMLVYLLLKFLP